jgi:starch phosphorylase
VAKSDKRLERITEQLIDGTFEPFGQNFWGIYDALLKFNDEYFVLGDFDSYVRAWEDVDKMYSDRNRWLRMSLVNIARSSYFSSDRAIREYAEDIWKAL